MNIQRISDFQVKLRFPNYEENHETAYEAFLESDLGKIYQSIPWQAMVKSLGLKDKNKGPKSIFSPRGKIALMFLKHYACCSDRKLISQLNANIDYQYFCDIYIPSSKRIKNYKIVSEIRVEIAKQLNIDDLQKVLAKNWLVECKELSRMVCDATCYESSMRYPTDVKLLWESVLWSHEQLKSLLKQRGEKMMRSKYRNWLKRYVQYSKMKRKTLKKKTPLKRALLKLLKKINDKLSEIEYLSVYQLVPKYWERRQTIALIYEQQFNLFHKNIKPKNRIVSIDKPYIRPIVRGKEIKKVEFGAKVHKFQIGGVSFIEHLSFDAFHEGNRLFKTIQKAQQLSGIKVKVVGADAIYATNANRTKITQENIKTDFKRKGKKAKDEKQRIQLSKAITKERASRMEGSFGTDKEHFLLKKILARTKETEKLWIFFGIHTSNALQIGRKIDKKQKFVA